MKEQYNYDMILRIFKGSCLNIGKCQLMVYVKYEISKYECILRVIFVYFIYYRILRYVYCLFFV